MERHLVLFSLKKFDFWVLGGWVFLIQFQGTLVHFLVKLCPRWLIILVKNLSFGSMVMSVFMTMFMAVFMVMFVPVSMIVFMILFVSGLAANRTLEINWLAKKILLGDYTLHLSSSPKAMSILA